MPPPAPTAVRTFFRQVARTPSWQVMAFSLWLFAGCTAPNPADTHVSAPFRTFYSLHHGADTLGAPLFTGQIKNGGLVQFFSNGVLEFHPGLPAGSQVFMSALGEEFGERQPPLTPDAIPGGALLFLETGHTVQGIFRTFYEAHGGALFFGYPIAEPLVKDGRIVQHFERAALLWDPALAADKPVQLLAWGERKFNEQPLDMLAVDGNTAESAAASMAAPPRITEFVEAHGGAELFGKWLGRPRTLADGRIEYMFENAVLIQSAATADAPPQLAALGTLARGGMDAPAAPVIGAEATHFVKTGHNVVLGMQRFLAAHGGAEILGMPVTELIAEDGRLVQYFENFRVEWQPALPDASAFMIAPLGQHYFNAAYFKTPDAAQAETGQLFISATVDHPVLAVPGDQTFHVWVLDAAGKPVAGAQVMLAWSAAAAAPGELPVTDAAGHSMLTMRLEKPAFAPQIAYRATTKSGALAASFASSFLVQPQP